MRALCVLQEEEKDDRDQQKFCRVLARLYQDFWVRHLQVAEVDVFTSVLVELLGAEEATVGMFNFTYFAFSFPLGYRAPLNVKGMVV